MRIFMISYWKVNDMKVTKNIVQRLSIIRSILTYKQNKISSYVPPKKTELNCKLSECQNSMTISTIS